MHSTIVEPTTDGESTIKFSPEDEFTQEVEDYINTHPLAHSLRDKAEFTEGRPHLKIPVEMRSHNLTAGTLAGPNKIVVPPYVWTEEGGKSLTAIIYLGSDVCGHLGIVHGGMLATILDETLARCCFPALPNGIGVTANLNVNYKSPAPSGSYYAVYAETTKVEGRKAWVQGRIESLPKGEEKPTTVVEATGLFVEPKNASV